MSEAIQRKRGNPLMVRGGPSLNPGGRPRRSLAAALRERFPHERLVQMVEQLASSESEETRRWALSWLSDRTEGKVADKQELGVAGAFDEDSELEAEYENLTEAQHEELEALEQRKAQILGAQRDTDPMVLDENTVLLPAGVARDRATTDED